MDAQRIFLIFFIVGYTMGLIGRIVMLATEDYPRMTDRGMDAWQTVIRLLWIIGFLVFVF